MTAISTAVAIGPTKAKELAVGEIRDEKLRDAGFIPTPIAGLSTGVARWADPAMFEAAPMRERGETDPKYGAQVSLLWMTPNPLGAVAAMCRMYEGIPTYDLDDIEDRDMVRYWTDALNTHLKAPLEAVKFHFFLEGVDRSFTHQMVRQRTAVFAQESLRFAVKANLATEAIRPITVVKGGDNIQEIWKATLDSIQSSYDMLIDLGIPAEDARGLLPHCVATRLNYVTDLRALADHAGNRLCTQAQFHWRYAFGAMVKAIRDYQPLKMTKGAADVMATMGYLDPTWQFEMIAGSVLFRPVCYQLGRCPFKATFDRACSIRERVDIRAGNGGTDSSQWHKPFLYEDSRAPIGTYVTSEGIRTEEWLLNPDSAR
jgi:thymidylate synthase ThyX